jgi:hypothetical protein
VYASESMIEIDVVAYKKFKVNLQVLNVPLSLSSPVFYCTLRHKYGNKTAVILTYGSERVVRTPLGARNAWPGSQRVYLPITN